MIFSNPQHYQLKRNQLKQIRHTLIDEFKSGYCVSVIINKFSELIDQMLRELWVTSKLHLEKDVCLIALGGYGRKELHLYSDIDLLCLVSDSSTPELFSKIEFFIRDLWDIGITIGHSTRSLTQCVLDAKKDVVFLSNLIDARLLNGNKILYHNLISTTSLSHIWPSNKFFQAKWKEQLIRYKKYSGSAYNLEPNIKHGPGGLRDIQIIHWLVNRHLQSGELAELVSHHFLTHEEYLTLVNAQEFLWKIRFALHYCAGRPEERLLFEYQTKLAKLFHYADDNKKLAIEKFMHDYYRTVNTVQELNDMLLQLFREAILNKDQVTLIPINSKFQLQNAYLAAINPRIFIQNPSSMLELFVILAEHPEIKGVSAESIRLLHQAKYLINEKFRQSPINNRTFLLLLRHSKHIAKQLQRMKRYGILGQFIPEFGNIIGQMQYDLFHIYTVDEHTLTLIHYLNNFANNKYQEKFPLCVLIMEKIKKRELLYIAGLFHDIGKGQGGDHSKLGADFAKKFSERLKLKPVDVNLITWLVENHLLMSQTAQKKDISDPYTIHNFVKKVKDSNTLNYLYLLTVADISATNPTLWNSWKDTLLKELYHKALDSIQQGSVDEEKIIQNNKSKALKLLREKHVNEDVVKELWNDISDAYFLSEDVNTITNHSFAIIKYTGQPMPLILAIPHKTQGGMEIFVYMPIHENSFTITTTILANYHLNILEARTYQTKNNFSLESYIVLDEHHKPLIQENLLEQIHRSLFKYLNLNNQLPSLKKTKITREKQHFMIPTKIEFAIDNKRNRTILSIISADRPGLLAQLSKAFMECKIRLHNIKISTAGERVEDVFYITDQNNKPVSNKVEQAIISKTMLRYLARIFHE